MRELIDKRYELTALISSGGMGAVWRGYDIVLDRPVAIKRIRVDQVETGELAKEFTERFRREARVTARIRHHGVPQVYDAVLDASFENVYLVMELIDGVTLRDYLDPDAQLPLSWVAAVTAQIATVLSHAHALPVVHRDLKPDNVLLTRDGSVKVIDFGIAAILDQSAAKITRTGQQIGTLRYMSPERIHDHPVTPRSDLYSLGCLMHEMVVGKPLFEHDSPYEVQRMHIEVAPLGLREFRGDVPIDLERLVLALVAKDPRDRPADAYAVYERLLPFLPAPGAPIPPGELYLPGLPDPTRIFRRPNAPLETSQVEPTQLSAAPVQITAPLTPLHLRTAIDTALHRYEELVEADRFAQAADALVAVINSAADARGADHVDVLELRRKVVGAWVLGGEYRRARTELESLAEAYRRTEGRFSESAWEMRSMAASCRMQIGDIDGGFAVMNQLLSDIVAAGGDCSEAALEMRLSLGELYFDAGASADARRILQPLRDDLLVLRGPDNPLSAQVSALLDEL
ncbi:protein kinase domain-containing protein [Nocardia sp. NPDC055165]|uniref:serine/threonine-protein kinase n=1 Tax=Nocardia sp. NPDC060220 TaxID=3347076 RepID=UPI00364FE888